MLDALDQLHLNGTSHRDITPRNVFIGSKGMLKIGDFGIAKMAKRARGVAADAYAPAFKPATAAYHWLPSDDIFQVGLLALTLLSGSIVTADVGRSFVSQCTTRDGGLRDVIKRAIAARRSTRYAYAGDMAADLSP